MEQQCPDCGQVAEPIWCEHHPDCPKCPACGYCDVCAGGRAVLSLAEILAMLTSALDQGLIGRERAARLLVEHAPVRLSTLEALDRLDAHRGLPTSATAMLAGKDALLAALDAVKNATTAEDDAQARLRLETELAMQEERSRERTRAHAWDLLCRPHHTDHDRY